MDKGYVCQGKYGKRTQLIPIFLEILDKQDVTSLTMLALFINNNPYNLEFFIAVNYDKPEKSHIQNMIYLFENAGLIYRNDLTLVNLIGEIGNRRFDSYVLNDIENIDFLFSNIFWFPEIRELESKGYFMKPFGKEIKS